MDMKKLVKYAQIIFYLVIVNQNFFQACFLRKMYVIIRELYWLLTRET